VKERTGLYTSIRRIQEPNLAELLALLDLSEGFTVDTQGGSWSLFESLNPNLNAAGITIAVVINLYSLKRTVDFLDELTLAI